MSTEPSSEPSNNDDKKTSRVFGIALIIFIVLAILPTVGFFQYGDLLFGEHAFAKVLLLSSMGGALSTSICTKGRKQRLMAILPGVVMGIGIPLTFISYIWLLHRENLFKIEFVFLVLVGIFPGFLLYASLIKPDPPEG